MNEGSKPSFGRYREGIFSAISAGFFFVLAGAIFTITPNLFDEALTFFRGFTIVSVPNLEISVPAPAYPGAHSIVYLAVERFSFIWGIFQVVILFLRFPTRSPLSKKAETVSNLVFWLGVGFLTRIFLIETVEWFVFWAGIIMLIGVSLIARAVILSVGK